MAANRKQKNKSNAHAQKMRSSKRSGSKSSPGQFSKRVLPAMLIVCILSALTFLVLMGYRTVTASGFFHVTSIEIRGIERSSRDDIERIIEGQTERSGAWNADLNELKSRIEKLTFVRTAAVSRVLPNGIRVSVVEKSPAAIVRLSSGDILVDSDGETIAAAGQITLGLPIIRGWDEVKSQKASKDNALRVKLYQKMVEQWSDFDLAKRVQEVDLSDTHEPVAIVEDSGKKIAVSLARDDFGKSLKAALEAIAGKGESIKSVDSAGVYPVIQYLGY